jgi:uncharacterized protein YrrD
MPNLRNLIGMPVMSADSGKCIGKVEELIIDSDMTSIKALLTVKPDFSQTGQNILETDTQELFGVYLTNLFHIGQDAVMVRNDRAIEDLSLFCITDCFYYSSKLFDKPIYTDTGLSLGVLADIDFDESTGEIYTYQISDGIFFDILYGRRLMPPPKAQVVGRDMLIVPDTMEKLVYYVD